MGWIDKLYETYENCRTEVGVTGADEETIPLLPIAHSTQNAQIEVVLDGGGNFRSARALDKGETVTIIPVTEDSATRSSGIAPHPLCDKLQYVAGDYKDYVQKKNSREFYKRYMEQLGDWSGSPYSHPKIRAVFDYLKKGTLIEDLVRQKILVCDDKDALAKGVKMGVGDQSDAFVRFRVEKEGEEESAVWLDHQVYESYINYYLSRQEEIDLCYVQGKAVPCSDKHPAKIRNTGDKSKLISANDSVGFTYRGRFNDKSQVVRVGYETTQKAHNALRWLIDRQGYKNGGDQVIVAWGTKERSLPPFLEDTEDFFMDDADNLFPEEAPPVTTEREFAHRLNKAIAGYGSDLDIGSKIVIMGLDAATVGRLAITYYREMDVWDFLNRIKAWHSSCIWKHSYKKIPDGFNEKGKPKFKYLTFIGAPAPKEITWATYGDKASDKLKKATVERLLPCILDGARMPYDLVGSAVNRLSNPLGMENWEWEKVLTITCALIRKYRYDQSGHKEVWEMSLDENQRDRSYLFGRLLAIAQQIEKDAQYWSGEKRTTNAERLMHQFKLHPYKTWGIITDKLSPYLERLGPKVKELSELMTKVNAMLPFEDFTSPKKLEDSYILGYYCQREVFIERIKQLKEEKEKKKLAAAAKSTEGENEHEQFS
ncbi:type I-C CRISPR-associated protein Cas8c/Csd1 [Desulfitobacterium hafniense]|uniref:type I-C CRISPR-associated protein Cas8c/Csd1 n=1 Tax=Desulfitobacterium hafniense TaxID=49338 RepID=UPI000377B15B|nr:type I-C CRISPR-associated protein Cas8c/Csd1 [Desulfitobacterium hafniense]